MAVMAARLADYYLYRLASFWPYSFTKPRCKYLPISALHQADFAHLPFGPCSRSKNQAARHLHRWKILLSNSNNTRENVAGQRVPAFFLPPVQRAIVPKKFDFSTPSTN